MGWNVDDTGLGVIFDRAIPPFAAQNLGLAVTGILRRHEIQVNDVDRCVCLPGGGKVVRALEVALSLDEGALDHERNVRPIAATCPRRPPCSFWTNWRSPNCPGARF